MRSHFELTPAEYERRRQGHLQRRRAAIVAHDVAQKVQPGDLVLEVGCGPGDVLAAVARAHPEARFLGIDVDAEMIEYAAAAHAATNLWFERIDVGETRLDVRARVVIGIDVIHHVHALGRFVRAIAAVLERDGLWTVIEPNSQNPYIWLHQERMRRAGLDEDHFHRALFEREAARSGLRIAGRSTAFVVPGAVRSVPRLVTRAERLLERVPVLGGSVVYRLEPA
jgi:2-polyprenyl-3-methyl-5-hydroxy-6-metoxy-1,4-benzoquinol methylase